MTNVRDSYIKMFAATAERVNNKPASKKANDWFLRPLGLALGTAKAGGRGLVELGMPTAAFWYFLKYIAFPAGAGYLLGDSLATSTSPSKDDLRAAENNALAKETVNKTKELEDLPAIHPQDRTPKDMSWIGGM